MRKRQPSELQTFHPWLCDGGGPGKSRRTQATTRFGVDASAAYSQGSVTPSLRLGVTQPWASLHNPVGIKTYCPRAGGCLPQNGQSRA